MASGGYEKNVLVWNIEHHMPKPKSGLGSEARELRKSKKISEQTKLQGHTDNVEAVVFNPQNSYELCSVSVDKKVILWDLRTGKVASRVISILSISLGSYPIYMTATLIVWTGARLTLTTCAQGPATRRRRSSISARHDSLLILRS